MKDRLIMDLCDGTGSWGQPYRDTDYEVDGVDIRRGQDVRLYNRTGAHGILAAVDCTHFSGSGARWWAGKGDAALLEGLSVVDAVMRIVWANRETLKWWAIENPVGRLVHYLGKPAMYFNPCDYGDPYTKKTCLWGEFNKPKENPILPLEGSKIHLMGSHQKVERSITPPGFARAFFEANP